MNRKHEQGSIVTVVSALVIVSILGYFFIYSPYVERREAEVKRVAEEQRLQAAEKLKQERQATANRECQLAASTLRNVTSHWQDAIKLASATPRIALAAQVGNMQQLRQQVMTQSLTECASSAKNALIEVMNIEINYFTLFLAQDSDHYRLELKDIEDLSQGKKTKAQIADEKFQSELKRLETCAPLC